jgi:hypothetical protein
MGFFRSIAPRFPLLRRRCWRGLTRWRGTGRQRSWKGGLREQEDPDYDYHGDPGFAA